MFTRSISAFHFVSPEKKLTPEWCYEAVNALWHHCNNVGLLDGKDVDEIEQYATGNIDMKPFKRMYKSIRNKMDKNDSPNYLKDKNIEGSMQFNPLPLIPSKINAAVATMQKVPFEISVKALDALAVKKREEDITFLKNKPSIEAELKDLAAKLGLKDVDLGTTKHSAVPYSSSPYGLDLNEPDELKIFVELLYSLSVESSFETVLQIFYELKNIVQFRLLESYSQFWLGVSCHAAYESNLTGLPEYRYIYPGAMRLPKSDLPDMSDRTHEFELMRPTVLELFNMFGDEIKSEIELEKIINQEKFGYCACNKLSTQDKGVFNTFKVNLVYCKIKSVDWIGVMPVVDEDGDYGYELTTDETKATEKIWAQNTYCFYWLQNTKYFFRIDKLGFAHRAPGQEQYQGFDTNIYKSQEKSAVEQSIGENKKAQIASIKMEHAILKSLPAGKVIDLKGMRSALEGLKKDGNASYTMERLITSALEDNIIIIDTEGFNGKNDGQLKPFYEMPGGLKTEIVGYENVILAANARIAQFTGINEQLTGTSANPEGLIGLQKLLINSSINALYYVQEGLTRQFQGLMNIWASIIKKAVEEGGKTKEAIVNFIGKEKTAIIDGLSDLPLHQMGVKISLSQREVERAKIEQKIAKLTQPGVEILTTADEYMLDAIENPKDKVALIAVKEKLFRKRQSEAEQRKFQQQQQLNQQLQDGQKQLLQAEGEQKMQEIYAKGEVQGKIMTLANQLGMSDKQMESLMKRALQRDRGIDQERKAINTIKAKKEAEAEMPAI